MNELLFEIGTEEIPAGFIQPAISYLKKAIATKLEQKNIAYGEIRTAATPRRLAISISDLADKQPNRRDEMTGPSTKAGFDKDRNPTPAAIGFARSKGVSVQDLQVIETPKGDYLMVVIDIPGRKTADILPKLLKELIIEIPFAKSMRWGNGSMTFARPIQWIVACYDNSLIPFSIGKISSGLKTRGHRFMTPDLITVRGYDEYKSKLLAANVIPEIAERKNAVIEEVKSAVEKHKKSDDTRALLDENLIDTVTNLVELPNGIFGNFSKKFLELPDDVLVTSMREHQKYFPVVNSKNELLPHFVAVNNTRIENQTLAANGHERVIRARLEDAFFFFNEDKKRTLEERRKDLSGIIFQNKLGTMLEKSVRMGSLCRFLSKILAPEHEESSMRAASLAKIDLLTEMVGEFPSLQGYMGCQYALRDGENEKIANAIQEHYLPLRSGSSLPKSIPGAFVGLSDRIDTLAGCFALGQKPTGTTDPFGLRRIALAIIHIIEDKNFSLSLINIISVAIKQYEKIIDIPKDTVEYVLEFIRLRFKNDLIAKGISSYSIDAATAVEFDDLCDCLLRIEALNSIRKEDNFKILASSYKRIRNITKENVTTQISPALFENQAEILLHETILSVQDEIIPLLEKKAYKQSLECMLRIKDPVDRFFEDVMVMTEDVQLRQNRLNLLTSLSHLIYKVGDISKMKDQ